MQVVVEDGSCATAKKGRRRRVAIVESCIVKNGSESRLTSLLRYAGRFELREAVKAAVPGVCARVGGGEK